MTQLSKHFSLSELTASSYATRNNINNQPNEKALANLKRLVVVLEQIREILRSPISISSGYRCPEVNAGIGSGSTSVHLKGLAADFNAFSFTAKEAASRIAPHVAKLGIDQLIFEGTWVHVGLSEGIPRNQVMTAIFAPGKKTTYVMGIQ